MNLRGHTLLLVLAVAIGTAFVDDSWVVREDGAGPVRIGVSFSQRSNVLRQKLNLPAARDDQACFYLTPVKESNASHMILEGRTQEYGLVIRKNMRSKFTVAGLRSVRINSSKPDIT